MLLLAGSVLAIGVAAYVSRRSPAIDPPCPPGSPCEDPIDVWPIVLPIVGGLLAVSAILAVVL